MVRRMDSTIAPGAKVLQPAQHLKVVEGAEWRTIGVMGVTGSGKSTFIRTVSGDSTVEVGEGVESCTSDLKAYTFHYGGYNISLVDSPGFNDTWKSETEILSDIARWLKESYEHDTKLSGIIYLHGLNQTRVTGSALRNLRLFRELCGPEPLKNVTLATTFWGGGDVARMERHESELAAQPDFWGDMIARGAKMARFTDLASGQKIIADILKLEPQALQIQKEMVDSNMTLINTGAGQTLNADLAALEAKHEADRLQAAEELKQALAEKDVEMQEILHKEQKRLDTELEKIHRQQRQLAADDRAYYRRLQNEHDDRLWELKEQYSNTEAKYQQQFEEMKKYNEEAMRRFHDLEINEVIAKIRLEEGKLREEERMKLEAEIERIKAEHDAEEASDETASQPEKSSRAKKVGRIFLQGLRLVLPITTLLTIGVPIGGGPLFAELFGGGSGGS